MPATMLQLDPTIPVTTPNGKGHALGWIDYGAEGDLFWIVADAKTGQVWITPTALIRMQANVSMGRTTPEKLQDDHNLECGWCGSTRDVLVAKIYDPLTTRYKETPLCSTCRGFPMW